MVLGAVLGHAEDSGAGHFERGESGGKVLGLDRAAARFVLGVEIQDEVAAEHLAERGAAAITGLERDIGGEIALLKHRTVLS